VREFVVKRQETKTKTGPAQVLVVWENNRSGVGERWSWC
jgi:hypothetical protein